MAAPCHVLWIGGRSGAGKSTVARRLARRHGLRWYSCDTRTWEHRDRAIAAGDAAAVAWERLDPAQRFGLSAAETIRLTLDRSLMVLDDVEALPDAPAVVAEGTNITPSMVPDSSLAIWLIARPAVRADRDRRRGWGAAGDEVDLIHEQQLMAELERAAAPVIDTSDHPSSVETIRQLETIAAGWLATRPRARERRQRQALIHEGNAAIVNQYRYGMVRSGNTEGKDLARSYDCECADPECLALVVRTLGSLPDPFTPSAAPILAPGHHLAD